jgi:uncharacterized protein
VKFLLWLVIAILVVAWLKKTSKVKVADKAAAEGRTSEGGERMICCARCGVFVPVSESVTGFAGQAFCSEEHRRLGKRT